MKKDGVDDPEAVDELDVPNFGAWLKMRRRRGKERTYPQLKLSLADLEQVADIVVAWRQRWEKESYRKARLAEFIEAERADPHGRGVIACLHPDTDERLSTGVRCCLFDAWLCSAPGASEKENAIGHVIHVLVYPMPCSGLTVGFRHALMPTAGAAGRVVFAEGYYNLFQCKEGLFQFLVPIRPLELPPKRTARDMMRWCQSRIDLPIVCVNQDMERDNLKMHLALAYVVGKRDDEVSEWLLDEIRRVVTPSCNVLGFDEDRIDSVAADVMTAATRGYLYDPQARDLRGYFREIGRHKVKEYWYEMEQADPRRQKTLSVRNAAKLLGVSFKTLYRMIEEGEVKVAGPKGRWRINSEEIMRLLNGPASGSRAQRRAWGENLPGPSAGRTAYPSPQQTSVSAIGERRDCR